MLSRLFRPLRAAVLRRERARMPAPLPDDMSLFRKADALLDASGLCMEPLAPEAFWEHTERHGIDLATAMSFRALEREHAGFNARVRAPLPTTLPQLRGHLLVVPAPQHDTLPGYGGDGALIRQVARALGLTSSAVALPTYDTLDANSARILTALAALDPGASGARTPLWLASISKSSADVRVAMETAPEAFGGVSGWISTGGLVGGTALARLTPPRQRHAVAALAGLPAQALDELSDRGRLAAPFAPPEALRTVSVVCCPLEAHATTRSTRNRWRRLAAEGPNDGTVHLAHAVVPGSDVLPVWGADHYFRVPDAARLLYGLLLTLAADA